MPTLTLSPLIQCRGSRDIPSTKLKRKPLEGALSPASPSEAGTVGDLSSTGKNPENQGPTQKGH